MGGFQSWRRGVTPRQWLTRFCFNFPSSVKGRYEVGKYGGKKESRAHNRYTGKRAQNVAWVRDYLHKGLEGKAKRGHVLGREAALVACKLLLIMEGVLAERAVAKMNQKEPKPDAKAKQAIKLPQLWKTL